LDFSFDPVSINLRVGLEIHQQLASKTKLFCRCPIKKSEELPQKFERRLRPTQSELGHVDPAAVFEYTKGKSNVYEWNTESSCLVDADEEPPRPLSEEALDTAILVSELLHSSVVDEIHVMRKIVIDGSNTAGFQRTAVVGLYGSITVDGVEVGVQSLTLEEDSARILGEDSGARHFALDRLGVPLVEITLDPVTGTPDWVEGIALHLGRSLRSTGRVARGLGSIRQDLNVSVMGGNVVEVKGVQKLNLLSRVLRYEVSRQIGLVRIAEALRKKKVTRIRASEKDVSTLLGHTESKVLQKAIMGGGRVVCIACEGLSGFLGYEPLPGIRLGRELAEVARANSLGGIIHSDEFDRHGISKSDAAGLRRALKVGKNAGLILVAGSPSRVEATTASLIQRIRAVMGGVPAETRSATDDGETYYMRPKPGAARMYPETDIPEIAITQSRREALLGMLPSPWEEKVREFEREYSLSSELALRVYDSDNSQLFEELAGSLKLDPSVIASVLVEVPVRLAREGVPEEKLSAKLLVEVLDALESGKIAKEVVPEVLRAVGKSEATDVNTAIEKLGLKPLSKNELLEIIDDVIEENSRTIAAKGENAFSPLMGEVMKRARGRVDGSIVSGLLREELQKGRKSSLLGSGDSQPT
jgi:glutamyl-tRNA(Gln) amidotransferase subunit E